MCRWISMTLLALLTVSPAVAQDRLQPYQLITEFVSTLADGIAQTREQLQASDFEIVGEYSPYEGTHVIAITHAELLQAAGQAEFGGYGAVLRVGLTEVDGEVQRSYPTPAYWGLALHIGELAPVTEAMTAVFGNSTGYGSKKGLKPKSLDRYRYMMMPRLGDHDELASFGSHEAAVAAVRRNLALSTDHVGVFELAIPGTEEVLFGVGLGTGEGADATVMGITDQADLRHIPHLPYGLLVSGNTAYALAGKFRIALAFPDLGMGTFMKISGAPDAIRTSMASLTEE